MPWIQSGKNIDYPNKQQLYWHIRTRASVRETAHLKSNKLNRLLLGEQDKKTIYARMYKRKTI